ncbi:MAG: 4-hydroxy-tetrahydrodipicolinate synthase [Flavobacteriaceae bacterium]|nr:4-hydroxy-tetrahydrodipicolinate synthase [Flavobacteriaceae bacterium]|tara:strand:- start:8158 stop:9072 length:915 start_codon:yes stop_codon:yes gene_type:complete
MKNKYLSIFSGVGVAVVTPFDENNNIDEQAIYTISDYLLENKISYVVVQGTTGESSTLDEIEKTIVNKFFVKAFRNKIPLVLGLSSNNTQELCSQIKNIDLDGFEAIMSVCPYYNKPSQDGIYQHFIKISKVSSKPILLYNVPSRTGVNISNETIINIFNDTNNIIGIKEASGDINRIKELKSAFKESFLIISGDDFTMIDSIRNGACGIISVAANLYPSLMVKTYNQLLFEKQNKNETNNNLNDKNFVLKNFIKLIFQESNPSGIKYAMSLLNLCTNKVRLPLTEVSKELKSEIFNYIKNFKK